MFDGEIVEGGTVERDLEGSASNVHLRKRSLLYETCLVIAVGSVLGAGLMLMDFDVVQCVGACRSC